MAGNRRRQLWHFAGQVTAGSLGVAAVTAVCFPAHVDFSIPSFLFLLVLVLQSVQGGFASSAVVSLIAAVTLEYFFIPPVLEWQIDDPEDGIALVTYWITCLVITRLASKAREQARVAEQRRRDTGRLYETASRLLTLAPEIAAGAESLRIFRDVFGLRAVCVFDAVPAKSEMEGRSSRGLAERTRDACIYGVEYQDSGLDLDIRCLYTGGKVTGAVGFEGRFDDPAIALPLSVLAATAMERVRSFHSASKAAADAQAEMLRSAILDAFAHEFKTPLAIILAAAGGLRETSAEAAEQREMTEIIENQTIRLSQLTTRLLRVARLDRDEVTPMLELVSLRDLMERLIEQCEMQFGRRISAVMADGSAEIMADPELLNLAITQLVDNACKYSAPGSVVSISLEVADGSAGILVSNEGSAVAAEEQEHIFERFFRGAETEHLTPGAGLGLYVARKIVRAHGGLLDLVRARSDAGTTTFRIRLPLFQQEPQYDEEAHPGICRGR